MLAYQRSRSPLLSFLCLALSGLAIALLAGGLFFAPTPGERFLQVRDQAEEILSVPSGDRFLPANPDDPDAVPALVRHRELAELLVMKTSLRTIMWSESTYPREDGISPYRVIYGGHTFDGPYDKHPDICVEVASGKITPEACHSVLGSTAAGACQFITPTWNAKVEKYRAYLYTKDPNTGEPVGEFHPLNQELICLLLFADTGAYDPLMQAVSVTPDGKVAIDKPLFIQAINLAAREWASFPLPDGTSIGKKSNQKAHPIDEIWQQFLVYLEEEEATLQNLSGAAPHASAEPAGAPEDKFAGLLNPMREGQKVAGYTVTSNYGMRLHPTLHVWRLHNGTDIGTPYGTPMLAPVPGTNTCRSDPPWGVYAWFEPDDLPGRAFMVHHTSVCEDGHYAPQETFAKTGNTTGVAGTGEHAHFGTWRTIGGAPESYEPPKGWFLAFLTGKIPDAAIEDS